MPDSDAERRRSRYHSAHQVQEELATRLPRAIQTAYAHGRDQDRAWAIRYLAHLFASNPTHGRILTHLAALCLPEPLIEGFQRMAARAGRSTKRGELER